MATLIFFLSCLVAMGNFLDFLLGKRGNRRAKDVLVEFYIRLNDGDGYELVRIPAASLSRYLASWLGDRFLSKRRLLRVAIISIPTTLLLFYWSDTTQQMTDDMNAQLNWPSYYSLLLPVMIIVNFISDYISWFVIQKILYRTGLSNNSKLVILLSLLSISQGYILFIFSSLIFGILLTVLNYMDFVVPIDIGLPELILTNLPNAVSFLDPLGHSRYTLQYGPIALNAISILIPHAMFVITIAICIIMYALRPIIQKPLGFIVQRAEESEKGVFTILASTIAAIIALINSIPYAIKHLL